MTDKQKASAVLNYLGEQDSNVVINILQSYIPDENLAALYDKMREEGIDIGDDGEDDTPEEMKEALDYVRENMDEIRMQEVKLAVDKAYEHHLTPSAFYNVGDTVTDLLEEYGDDNDLPEGWWENYGDIDDWLLKL